MRGANQPPMNASSRILKGRESLFTARSRRKSRGAPATWMNFSSFGAASRDREGLVQSFYSAARGPDPEILTPSQRAAVIADLRRLRVAYPVLEMPEPLIRELESPPQSPKECIFARTTQTISADLRTQITPCQFGGDPDCGQCGCIASMALAAVGHHRVLGKLTAGQIFLASDRIGKGLKMMRRKSARQTPFASGPSSFNKEQLVTSIGKMRDSNS